MIHRQEPGEGTSGGSGHTGQACNQGEEGVVKEKSKYCKSGLCGYDGGQECAPTRSAGRPCFEDYNCNANLYCVVNPSFVKGAAAGSVKSSAKICGTKPTPPSGAPGSIPGSTAQKPTRQK